jgi:hypothetical protein
MIYHGALHGAVDDAGVVNEWYSTGLEGLKDRHCVTSRQTELGSIYFRLNLGDSKDLPEFG